MDLILFIDGCLVLLLGVLQISDFLFTWFGINVIEVIEEGNFLMIWLFDLTFWQAAFIRFLLITIIIITLSFIRNESRKGFLIVMFFGLFFNIIITYMHYMWLLPYLK